MKKLILSLNATLLVAASGFAASQTWSNAPANVYWNTNANWIANATPGGLNMTGNTVNNDVATFNSALFSGIGGEANPILTDDATTLNRSRQIGGITFDTASCGAYVISNATATAPTPSNGVLYVSHNGTIQLTAAVTNPQRIMAPLNSRGPSSTDGVYNFVNNAANSLSTLYINAVTSNIGTTRGTRWILGGSNTGTNTVAAISRGNNGSTTQQGIRKQGTGTWILSGPNEMNNTAGSLVEVNEGTLIARDAGALGQTLNVFVNSNAVLQVDGVILNQTSMNLTRNGTIRMNGAASVNGVVVGNTVVGASPTFATTSASDVFTVGSGLTATSLISGGAADTVLNTAGPGTLVFGQSGSQVNTYAGRWNFAAKTNQLNHSSALGTGGNANVAAGAILDLTPLGPTTFAPTTSGFGGSGTGTALGSAAAAVIADSGTTLDLTGKAINLAFTPTAFSGDTTHPSLIIAQGSLTLGGNTFFINNASGTALGLGTYRLIQQTSGSVTSGGGYAALISGSGVIGGTTASISVSGGNVDLVIAAYVPKNLKWKGGNPDAIWNLATTANFDNSGAFSVYNNSDTVTFDSLGSANPVVTVSGTLAPGSVTVDTTANNYTFTGSGSVAGTTALTKTGTGTLLLQTVNSYAGGTVVGNGTLQVGANNAISSTGAGDVLVNGSGIIDLNNFNNSINGLSGNGTVDNTAGGAAVLTVGNNNKSGTFTGILKNTSGTLGISKVGTNLQVLSAANSYSGPTTVSGGTLATVNANALGVGSDLTINTGGTLDVRSAQLSINSLAGGGGSAIVNNTTSSTNRITITGTSTTTFGGSMSDGAGGGGMALTLLGGNLTVSANNTYSGGTIVASGATFNIANSPAGVAGGLIASNSATLGLSGGSGTPGTPATVTTVDGATVSFTSGALGKIWGGQFYGGANSTNRILNEMSFGGDTSFKNFLGVVNFELSGTIRFINIPGGTFGGSDSTTFDFVGGTAVTTRDPATVLLGHIRGGSPVTGIAQSTGSTNNVDTFILGGRNIDSTFEGYVRGSNNIVKSGTARLTFDGVTGTTNTDSATYTNVLYSSLVAHAGSTTVSNGVLGLVVPNNLSNSPSITLATSTAILDASQMGYVSNFTDVNGDNSVLVTNGTLQVYAAQTLAGLGTIRGSVIADAGSTVAPGLSIGVLTVTNAVTLNGTVNMELDHFGSPNADRINGASINVNGATINVTNIGTTDLATGDVFQLFSGPVTGVPAALNLPVQNQSATITYVWTNKLAFNGTIQVLSGGIPVNPNPTNIVAIYNGSTLDLSWPLDHVGWTLQTNDVGVAATGSWFPHIPNTTGTNHVIISVNPSKPQVYYRLKL